MSRSLLWSSGLLVLLLALSPLLRAEEPPAAGAPVASEPAPVAKAEDSEAEDSEAKPAPQSVTGRFEILKGQPTLTLWGSARERGYAQGYLLAEQIVAGVAHDFERVMKPFLPKYEMLVKKMVIPQFTFNEREAAELEGLFAGLKARLPKEKLHIAALERDIELVDVKALNTFGDWYGLGCSSLAVWGELSADGGPLVGRNFDFPAFDLVLRHQYVVIRSPAEGVQGYVGVSYPGCIGILTGLNASGVFTAIHDVPIRPSLDKALRPNVPRLMAVRRILEHGQAQDTCEQIHDLVRKWPTLYGNNLMVVGPTQKDGKPCAGVLEYDCRVDMEQGCTMRLTGSDDPSACCLACTNHHRVRKEPEHYLEFKKRWRYPKLAAVGGEGRPEKPLGVAEMFAWMGRTAFPKPDQKQGRAETLIGKSAHHGTLHQAVAQPDARMLFVRLGLVGSNIRDIKQQSYDVAKLLAPLTPKSKAAPAQPAAEKQPAGAAGG